MSFLRSIFQPFFVSSLLIPEFRDDFFGCIKENSSIIVLTLR